MWCSSGREGLSAGLKKEEERRGVLHMEKDQNMAHLVHVGNFIIWFSKHVINKKKTNRSSLFFSKSISDSILKGDGGGGSLAKLSSLKSGFVSQSLVSILPGTVIFRNFHPNDRGGRAGLSR